MSLLGKFSIGGALDKILAAGDPDMPQVQAALNKLTDHPKEAMQKILKEIQSGPKLHYSTCIKLVSRLLDNRTIGDVLKTLPQLSAGSQYDIATILNTSQNYDPHLILPYLRTPLSLKLCRDLITAHRKKLQAQKLLNATPKIDPDLWDTVFELIHASSDEPTLAEAIALSYSKNQELRELVISVIAEFNNPAAMEALQELLNDNNPKIRSAALHGLVRAKASLPVTTLLTLMAQTKKDDIDYVKALIRNSRDPQLIPEFIQKLFGKNTKGRPLAIMGLAELMSQQTLRQIFEELSGKPEATRESLLKSLYSAAEDRYETAISELIHDYSPEISNGAAQALTNLDTSSKTVFQASLEALELNLLPETKQKFIENLGESKNIQAIEPLGKIISGNEDELKIPTLNALAQIGDVRALPPVFESLNEKNPELQRVALESLLQITPDKLAGKMRDQLLELSGHIHADALETLIATVEEMTEKHDLRATTTYQTTLDKLRKDTTGEMELPGMGGMFEQPSAELFASAEGNAFGGGMDDAFGGSRDGVFGTANEEDLPENSGDPVQDFAIDLEEGLVLGNRYKLIREIGRGGYGSVWLIEDTFIKEEMVMKFLHQQLVSDEIAIERFIRELRLARKITHKNIIRLFDYLDLGKISAISMEYFDGKPLSKRMLEAALKPKDVIEITKTVCLALQTAHDSGVIHRDMKPANILVNDDNEVKIVDFGIASASKHAESRLTRTGTLIGTPTYISPEQIQGREIDSRTDIYSLGIIMYEMLTGKPPYLAEDPMALIFLHVEGDARRVEDANPLVSEDLANIVHKCIAPEPDDRYQSMTELKEALNNIKPS